MRASGCEEREKCCYVDVVVRGFVLSMCVCCVCIDMSILCIKEEEIGYILLYSEYIFSSLN